MLLGCVPPRPATDKGGELYGLEDRLGDVVVFIFREGRLVVFGFVLGGEGRGSSLVLVSAALGEEEVWGGGGDWGRGGREGVRVRERVGVLVTLALFWLQRKLEHGQSHRLPHEGEGEQCPRREKITAIKALKKPSLLKQSPICRRTK